MKYLIIGNGVAGIEAALSIRKNDLEGDITVVTASPHHYYYRPKLIDYIAGETTIEKFTLYKEDFYTKQRISIDLGKTIVSIDTHAHKVAAKDGLEYTYDRLLLATGADPSIPPIKGVSLSGVFSLRGIEDANAIMQYCSGIENLVVIGGGLLGLETAFAMNRFVKNITVIEYFEWLLPRQLDKTGGAILKNMLEKKGIRFALGESVAEIVGSDKVESIRLKSGKLFSADAVIISTGIRPKLDLPKSAGINVGRGIIVDDYMKTSADDVFAAGDSIEHDGCMYGIYPAAREQGKIAGLNMAGITIRYTKTIISNILKITGIDLYSAGEFNKEDAESYSCASEGSYKKYLVKNGPVGAIILGDPQAMKVAQKVMEGKAEAAELIRMINSPAAS